MRRILLVSLVVMGVGMVSTDARAKCPDAVSFPHFADLSARQKELISLYLPNAEENFNEWSVANDGLATEFLANTQALDHLKLRMADGSEVTATDMIVQINHIEGDRMKVEMNVALFSEWRTAGSHYRILESTGRIETGQFHFNHGDLGGSLHHTYDTQGYTSYIRVPRVQFNYREMDHEADIDLDAYAPWIMGFIPDPFHLTWDNSDPRCWVNEFERKFGKLISLVLKK